MERKREVYMFKVSTQWKTVPGDVDKLCPPLQLARKDVECRGIGAEIARPEVRKNNANTKKRGRRMWRKPEEY